MIASLLIGTTRTLVIAALSEKLILRVTLALLQWAAEKSTNEVDNKLVALMEEQLQRTGVI